MQPCFHNAAMLCGRLTKEKLCLETVSTFPSSQANYKAGDTHLLPSTPCFLIIVFHSEVRMYNLSKVNFLIPFSQQSFKSLIHNQGAAISEIDMFF